MKFIAQSFLAALLVFAPACLAQEWEVGGMVGGGFSSDLTVSNAGTSATFQGQTHSIDYDILVYARSARSRVRPFALAGGGMRDFRGVGTESSYQALSNFALLTKTSQWTPVATFGGGVKFAIAPRVLLRVEVRDYLSRFPTQVIAPAPGAHLSGWLNDLVPMAGITYVF
jgi:hypothetical protein